MIRGRYCQDCGRLNTFGCSCTSFPGVLSQVQHLWRRAKYEAERLSAGNDGFWNSDFVIHREIANFLPSGHFDSVLDYGEGNSSHRDHISCDKYLMADIIQNIHNGIDCVIDPGTRLAIPDATFDLVVV